MASPTSRGRTGQAEAERVADPIKQARRLRLAIGGAVLVFVAIFAVLIIGAVEEEGRTERWSVLETIRSELQPQQDPLWNNPYGLYNAEREKLLAALKKFIAEEASQEGDALEPYSRWLVAKAAADHVLSNPDMLGMDKRSPFYKQALDELALIVDSFPEFPLNWTEFRDQTSGSPTLARQFVKWLEENQAWEQENLPKAVAPDGKHVIVVRTSRGDLRLQLYETLAPARSKAFLDRALKGYYDGTAIFGKVDVGTALESERVYVRGGDPRTRGAKAYDKEGHLEFAKKPRGGGLLPEESRNRITHDRGIVSVWHEQGYEYDDEAQFLIVERTSPRLNYKYTPFGKLTDTASLDTLSRIFEHKTWRDDKATSEDNKYMDLNDVLQVPVRIVKILVFEDGQLVATPDDALSTKVSPTDGEKSLGALDADAYLEDVPPPPPTKDSGDDDEDSK